MLFNSIEFAIFFPIVVALFFLSPQSWRVRGLLAASCIFYMAFIPAYISILFVTILIDYFAGMHIEKLEGAKKSALLCVSIVSTCVVLFVFKYLNFFTSSFVGVAGLFGWHLPHAAYRIILPIGLSFHTFQSLSYVIEVYRGKQKAEHNFIVYATYVMFFPNWWRARLNGRRTCCINSVSGTASITRTSRRVSNEWLGAFSKSSWWLTGWHSM